MRGTGLLILGAAMLTAGCDKRSPAPEQAQPAATSAPAPAPADAPAAGKIDRSHKGEAAPGYAFQDASGKTVTLAAFRGRPVLVNLWATWCGPCVKELPTLDALAGRNKAVQVVALSQDDEAAKVKAFAAQHAFTTLRPYLDTKMQWLPAVTSNLPTTILYDATGHEVWRTLGDLDWTGPAATAALADAG